MEVGGFPAEGQDKGCLKIKLKLGKTEEMDHTMPFGSGGFNPVPKIEANEGETGTQDEHDYSAATGFSRPEITLDAKARIKEELPANVEALGHTTQPTKKRKSPMKKANNTNTQTTPKRKPANAHKKRSQEVEEEWVENVKVDLSEGIRRSSRQRSVPSRFVGYERIDEVTNPKEEEEMDNTIDFVDTLHDRTFLNAFDVVKLCKNGLDLTLETVFMRDGFRTPMLVLEPTGLDIKIPNRDFDVDSVARLVGNRPLDVIDVKKQSEVTNWTMENWANYYNQPPEERKQILNVISLEFSDSKLAEYIESPRIVREVDWIDHVWPKELKEKALNGYAKGGTAENTNTVNPLGSQAAAAHEEANGKRRKVMPLMGYYPKVQYYCLMSVKGSYTDFHIDFGGSSVWYHIVYGGKVFYLIEPSKKNLELYAKWLSDPYQSHKFFGDMVDKCYKIVLKPGNTFFIPSGWIHSVYTPEDSLVFGGNFIHGFSISKQLRVFDIENRSKTRKKFRFPLFESLQWYALRKYLSDMKDETKRPLTAFEKKGLISMVRRLRQWKDKSNHRQHIPADVDVEKDLPEMEALLGVEPLSAAETNRRRKKELEHPEEDEEEENEEEYEEGQGQEYKQQKQQQQQQGGSGGMDGGNFSFDALVASASAESIESLHAMPFTSTDGGSGGPSPFSDSSSSLFLGSPSSTPQPKSVKIVLKRKNSETAEGLENKGEGGGEATEANNNNNNNGKRVRRKSTKAEESKEEEEEEEEILEEISEDEAAELLAERDGGEFVLGKPIKITPARGKSKRGGKGSRGGRGRGGGGRGGRGGATAKATANSNADGGGVAAASPTSAGGTGTPTAAATTPGGGGAAAAAMKKTTSRERLLKKIGAKPSALYQSWRKK